MHESYTDIRSRIDAEPLWWDENAVPRYEPFTPRMLANIYWREAALMLIACQNCGHEFAVAMSASELYWQNGKPLFGRQRITNAIREGTLHYGDPPNIGCCGSGPTMNSVPRQILEVWRRDRADAERVPEVEGPYAGWAEEGSEHGGA